MKDTKNSHQAIIAPIPDSETRPLWSVMIPTYNCAEYLRKTLSSVLSQDPGSDVMQIEVIDDHSTQDDPAAIVEELGQGRVGFYRQPENVGFIKNFETCLQRARGYLIHQLHGDDYVVDGFYDQMQKVFEQNPDIGAAFSRYITMDQQGHWQSISQLEQSTSGVLDNWLQKIATGQRIATPSIVVHRKVYEKFGGFDRRIICCGEDWEMWVRIAANYSVAYEPKPLAVYRFKPLESLPPSRVYQIMHDMQTATEIIESYLSEHLVSSVAKQVLDQAREKYALWPLETVKQNLSKGNIPITIDLLQEVFKFSNSFNTKKKVFKTILKSGVSHIKQVVYPAKISS